MAKREVNNAIYGALGSRWYDAKDDPVALLRAESRQRAPWVVQRIAERFGDAARVLDVGCGGGFLANDLAERGHRVIGLDAARDSLEVAADHGNAAYVSGDAYSLPFAEGAFQVVCALDFLEHVDRPNRILAEVARVLAPGGLFFFHTFNRNWLAWLVVIKGVEWFVRNTPRDMHVLRLFLRPDEVETMCRTHGMRVVELLGSRPRLDRAMWRMLRTGIVPDDFRFLTTRSTRLAYSGMAVLS